MIEALFAMGGSATAGFIFKLITNHQANKAKEMRLLIARNEAIDNSMDKAEKRGGVWMRRFVVFVFITLFAYLSSGINDPTNIVSVVDGDSYLWGLIQFKPETIVTTVNGSIMDDTLKVSILSIISFLFGVDAASRD